MINGRIVLQVDREQRLWRAHKKKEEIDDAVKRAEMEALKYLNSEEGHLWLVELSFERAEEVMHERGLDHTREGKEQAKEYYKKKVIKKYNKIKKKIVKKRDQQTAQYLKEVEELKWTLKTAKPGFARDQMNERLAELYQQLANMKEDQELQRMHEKCEAKCREIDERYEAYIRLHEMVEEEDSTTMSSIKTNSQKNLPKETYKEKKKRLYEEKRKEALAKVRGTSMPPEIEPMPNEPIKDMIYSTLEQIPTAQELKGWSQTHTKKMKLTLQYALDAVQIRFMKLLSIANGNFKEIQQEIQHAAFYEYVNHMKAIARRQAEDNFYIISKIRGQWDGLGMETCFRAWKKWCRNKVHRQHADIRNRWRLEKKIYEQDLITLHLAEAQLSLWVKHTDVYTDAPFWKNWSSGALSWVEPKLLDYVPDGFNYPKKPTPLPPYVDEETSDEEEEDYEATKRKQRRMRIRNGEEEDEESETKDKQSQTTVTETTASEANMRNVEVTGIGGAEDDSVASDITDIHGKKALRVNVFSSEDDHDPGSSVASQQSHVSKNPNDFSPQKWKPASTYQLLPAISGHENKKTFSKSMLEFSFGVKLPTIPNLDRAPTVLPEYSYGPDSLRAGKFRGRLGRPVFQEKEENINEEAYKMVQDLDSQEATSISEDAASILDSYSYNPQGTEEEKENDRLRRLGKEP